MNAHERAEQLGQQLNQYQYEQHQLLTQIQSVLQDATQGHQPSGSSASHGMSVEEQIGALTLLTKTREYVALLKAAAEQVKQLERLIRPVGNFHEQDVEQLVNLAFSAAGSYASCLAELDSLSNSSYPAEAAPQQLRAMEQQLNGRLQAAHSMLHNALSSHISTCLAQCGWPPPLVTPKTGPGADAFDASQMFSPTHAQQVDHLQRLMLALTRLQLAADKELRGLAAASGGDASRASDPPLLWMAGELAGPLTAQLLEVFGPSAAGSPGALDNPELVLGTVQRLAQENTRRVDFLQAVVQAVELHGTYHIGVEFTRALREAVKQLLRQYKLPEVAAAGSRELWLAWIDALIAFEGSLARSGLLGCCWEVGDAGDLPLLLLRNSTLSVLGEDPAWMDAWLEAEAAAASSQVEAALYSEAGWGPGQALLVVEEGTPAWQVDLWPPRAAEEVASLVESLLSRLRFISSPEAQARYLQGAVGAVLEQAHGRISRMLQQADVFRDITGYTWLPRVCMCICFCHFVEQTLQEMHDDAQVVVTRLIDGQQQLQQQQQGNNAHHEQQQQQHALANGSGPMSNGQQQHLHQQNGPVPGGGADDVGHGPSSSDSGNNQQHQQQDNEQLAAAAAAKLRLLARPIGDFSSCRREWVLKLGKAAAMGFMHHAAGYVSRGALFKVTSEALPAMAADGSLWSSGVVSGELQPALAWLAGLLHDMSNNLDKDCFRQAWGAAAAAINRELFNNVACEAIFSDAGALQLTIDLAALMGIFSRYTPRPAAHFREMNDAVKLLNLQQQQAEFVRQAVSSSSRAANAVEVLKSVGVYHLDPDLADTVMSLRMFK